MPLPTQDKISAVAEFKDKLANSEVAVATTYIGINVAQVTDLRNRMRAAGIDFKVYKNTLARLALREMDVEGAADFMEGPTAWAFSKDPVAPAKILKQYSNEVKFVSMMGGVLNGKVVNKAQLVALASLPPREQLLAQVVGTIAAPLSQFVGVLNALPRNLVNVLDQIRKQKEEAGAQAA
ncbi:MAG TPA: 50S ribosomal protein L10 [Candidatus Hydrogenedentes bacterium]|nr:50S ribosomal protein L10 [Candidatus Hydrogenedentota bacterium]